MKARFASFAAVLAITVACDGVSPLIYPSRSQRSREAKALLKN